MISPNGEREPMTAADQRDIEIILARRRDNGADYWATPDGRVYVGSPFSTISSLGMLHELGLNRSHEAVRGALETILAAWREDGKIRLAPTAPLYPCYTAEAARMLGRYGTATTNGFSSPPPPSWRKRSMRFATPATTRRARR